jgi:hypothetical protein
MIVSSCFGERHGRDAMNSVFLRCLFCIFEKEKNKKPLYRAVFYFLDSSKGLEIKV